jgi:ferric-dicitrate binding protein FerR (iron transport regulator)
MTPSDRTESRRLAALTDLLKAVVKQPPAAELEQELSRLMARMPPARARRRSGRWPLMAAAVLSCFAIGLAGWFLSKRSGPAETAVVLSGIEGGKLLEGGYLSETGTAGIQLSFDEGSKFVLSPGTRGRLRAVATEGTRLAIEHGEASFRITENPARRWFVEAGPFVVSVRGTDFTVIWQPQQQQVEVRLRRGHVVVSGPVVGDGLGLRPGQNLTVSLPRAEVVITEGRSQSAVPTGSAEAAGLGSAASPPPAPVADAKQEPAASRAHAAARPAASARRWDEAMANGQWDRILADVDREGVAATLLNLDSDELFALADAARYRRRTDLARLALLEQRRRFPSSPRSLDAIFLLGRVEETRAGGRAVAIERYDEYLSRAPAGTYAAEALGRRMILTKAVEGPLEARRVAEEYLRRFPQGSYAPAARALREVP